MPSSDEEEMDLPNDDFSEEEGEMEMSEEGEEQMMMDE